ncbi:LuxR C-terminal-related transcriptional regulator [Glutamicibacter sp. BW77]|uniref:response regulator transcription factor n=1 Tax=Glutamicibacter TaxID=1742989 RepID=UPI000BB86CC3|nr:LuxR C-terminal-related transcriptional regulator [Glutamicibacter sp. BW77]PCC37204.1 hypothetical protein CIK74_01820 [Glutamicibacter sp. BW77]
MTAQFQPHPAFQRFMGWANPRARLLLVRAAQGTGRFWFANSWIGDGPGQVHDFSAKSHSDCSELEVLDQQLAEDPNLRAAVILSPGHTVWHLALHAPVQFAEQRDLLLSLDEIPLLLGGRAGSGTKAAGAIFRQCGGWLTAARKLAEDQQAVEPALQLLRDGLSMWLAHRDPHRELSEAAILSVFDEATVAAYYGRLTTTSHTVGDLVQCGLLQGDGDGGWLMPEMVRQLLLERVRLAGAERMEILEDAALEAAISEQGLIATAQVAIAQQRWASLSRIVVGKWDELYLLDPMQLTELASQIPSFVARNNAYLGLGVRLLDLLTHDKSGPQFPRIAPNYGNDNLAQSLRTETDRLFLNPDARAVTVGLLEMLYLRFNGMYAEAGEASLRLRDALHKASGAHEMKSSFLALIHAQAGNSLYLAGSEVEALQSYELSLAHARKTGNAYLLSDPSGKLAMLHGDMDATRKYLDEHEQHIGQVRWGQAMLERGAILARAYLASGSLDSGQMRRELGKLPRGPDSDEFWSVHAYLLAMEKISSGLTAAARKLVYRMRQQRAVASRAPLARRLLDDILATAALVDHTYLPDDLDRNGIDPALLALKHLSEGRPDAALAELDNRGPFTGLRRGGNLGQYARMAALSPEGATPELAESVRQAHADSGSLYEIAMLKMLPGWGSIDSLLEMGSESARRLGRITVSAESRTAVRPLLTQRERDVLSHLREGKSRKEIAEQTFRSENTIKTQIRSLYRKLEANNLKQMLDRARTLGL